MNISIVDFMNQKMHILVENMFCIGGCNDKILNYLDKDGELTVIAIQWTNKITSSIKMFKYN